MIGERDVWLLPTEMKLFLREKNEFANNQQFIDVNLSSFLIKCIFSFDVVCL